MSDREITIKALKVIANPIINYVVEMPREYMSEGGFPLYKEMARDAIKLLEEQEPVESFHRCIGKSYSHVQDMSFSFCPYCGRKVKWDADD